MRPTNLTVGYSLSIDTPLPLLPKSMFSRVARLTFLPLAPVSLFCYQKAFCIRGEDATGQRKLIVGYKSVDDHVESNSIVGIGTGTTAHHAMERLGQHLKSGRLTNVQVIPCSEFIKNRCIALSIPVTTLSKFPRIDVLIDGADEVDPNLNMIKGGSGSFLREKIVAKASDKVVIVIDESKLTRKLGPGVPLPVEVIPFSAEYTRSALERLPALSGSRAIVRQGTVTNITADGSEPAVTDNGNYIIDLYFEKPIEDVEEAACELEATPGVVDHGLFVGIANTVLVATDKGVQVAGDYGEVPWWGDDRLVKLPTSRLSVDNRRPLSP